MKMKHLWDKAEEDVYMRFVSKYEELGFSHVEACNIVDALQKEAANYEHLLWQTYKSLIAQGES